MDTTRQHLTDEELAAYSRWQLPIEQLMAVDEHLAGCELCYARSRGDERLEPFATFIRDNLRDAAVLDCLSFEQIAAIANDDNIMAEDRQYIEDHLALCKECKDLAQDFRRTRRQIDSSNSISTGQRQSLGNKAAGFLKSRRATILVQGSVGTAIALVLLLAIIPLRKRVVDLQQQINLARQQAGEARQQEDARTKNLQDQVARLKDEVAGSRLGGGSMAGGKSTIVSTIVLRDGGRRVILGADGNLSGLESVPAAYQELVREALTSQRLRFVPAKLPNSKQPGVRLGPGEGESFNLFEPVGKALLSDRPTLKWEPVPGAERYIVFVRGIGSDFQIESEPTAETQWTTTTALPRGHTYSWAVEAVKEGRRLHAPAAEAPAAHFKILERSKSDELARGKRASGGSHLVMAALYAKYGLLAEAEAELQALRGKNARSQVVAKLTKSLSTKH
jgi:hypothetical protein